MNTPVVTARAHRSNPGPLPLPQVKRPGSVRCRGSLGSHHWGMPRPCRWDRKGRPHLPLSTRKCRALGCRARALRPWIQPLRTVGTFQAAQPRVPVSPKRPSSNSPCWEAKEEVGACQVSGNLGQAGDGFSVLQDRMR